MPSDDISSLLSRWPYDEDDELQVRVIHGRDGVPRLQIRIDLGVMQMETTGRPDGRRPYGFESLLEFYRHQAEDHRRRHGWYEGFELDGDDCAALRQESLQYYHRRVALMTLQAPTCQLLATNMTGESCGVLIVLKGDCRRATRAVI